MAPCGSLGLFLYVRIAETDENAWNSVVSVPRAGGLWIVMLHAGAKPIRISPNTMGRLSIPRIVRRRDCRSRRSPGLV